MNHLIQLYLITDVNITVQPNVRYVLNDIIIHFMHKDFKENYPEPDKSYNSYEYYRYKVKDENISFAQLGHEEYKLCESFNIHEHDENQIEPECDIMKNLHDSYKSSQ